MRAQHRGPRGARLARRDDREYREYLREEQRRQPGCIAGRMPAPFMRRILASARRYEEIITRTVTHYDLCKRYVGSSSVTPDSAQRFGRHSPCFRRGRRLSAWL